MTPPCSGDQNGTFVSFRLPIRTAYCTTRMFLVFCFCFILLIGAEASFIKLSRNLGNRLIIAKSFRLFISLAHNMNHPYEGLPSIYPYYGSYYGWDIPCATLPSVARTRRFDSLLKTTPQ